MAIKPLMLEGFAESAEPEISENEVGRKEVQRLQDENRSLRREVEDLTQDKQRLIRTVENLRRILGPIHNGLRALFGEIELAVGEGGPLAGNGASTSQAAAVDPRWESYKQRFPGVPARVIDALLVHGEMQVTHLAKLVNAANKTVYNAGDKLAAAGAISRGGGIWSLRR